MYNMKPHFICVYFTTIRNSTEINIREQHTMQTARLLNKFAWKSGEWANVNAKLGRKIKKHQTNRVKKKYQELLYTPKKKVKEKEKESSRADYAKRSEYPFYLHLCRSLKFNEFNSFIPSLCIGCVRRVL